MALALITFWQVVTLFLLIFTGALGVKTGVIAKSAKSVFADLLLYIIIPAMTVNSYLVEYSEEMSRGIGRAFLYSAFAMLLGLALSLLLHRSRRDGNRAVRRFAGGLRQRRLHGLPAHPGAVRRGGAGVRQRLCDRVQHTAVHRRRGPDEFGALGPRHPREHPENPGHLRRGGGASDLLPAPARAVGARQRHRLPGRHEHPPRP